MGRVVPTFLVASRQLSAAMSCASRQQHRTAPISLEIGPLVCRKLRGSTAAAHRLSARAWNACSVCNVCRLRGRNTLDRREVAKEEERNHDDGQNKVKHLANFRMMVTLRAWSSRPQRQLRSQIPAYCLRELPTGSSLLAFHHTPGASRISEAFGGDPAVTAKSSVVTENMSTVTSAASLRWPPCRRCRVPKSSSTAASRSRPGRSGPSQGFLPARERQRDLGVAQSHARKASRQSTFSAAAKSTQTNLKSRRFGFS